MIHPNRTYLLQQKAKRLSAENSLDILKARRQALIVELLASASPFLLSRKTIASKYRRAIEELQLSLAREKVAPISSIASVNDRTVSIQIEQRNILGVRYKEAKINDSIELQADQRQYDIGMTSPHLEEAVYLFEKIAEEMLEFAAYENKLKKLSRDIRQLSRKSRVLEQRILPALNHNLKVAGQQIGERDREDYYRLKRFKDMRKS